MANADDSRNLSEFELIERFTDRPPDPDRVSVGIGDDATVIDTRGRVVTSVDSVVEGVHFRRDWASPEQIGIKAVGSALSDLAAMGAGEHGIDIYVALGVPRDTEDAFLEGIARGVARTARRNDATLAGGDTVSSPVLFLSVTVAAHLPGSAPFVSRSGAKPGDLIAVTGVLGAAITGLWLLENPALPVTPELSPETRRMLIGRQLEVRPRLAAGAVLARSGAGAMIDLSDGLVADLGHVARRSSTDPTPVQIRVDAEKVPTAPGVEAVSRAVGVDSSTPALTGGEDYELAVALPPKRLSGARDALAAIGVPLTVVGEVTASGPADRDPVAVFRDDRMIEPGPGGFDHFRA